MFNSLLLCNLFLSISSLFHKNCRMESNEDQSLSELEEEIFEKFRAFMTG